MGTFLEVLFFMPSACASFDMLEIYFSISKIRFVCFLLCVCLIFNAICFLILKILCKILLEKSCSNIY